MNTHDKIEMPPLPFVGGLSTPDYEKAMHEWCYAAIDPYLQRIAELEAQLEAIGAGGVTQGQRLMGDGGQCGGEPVHQFRKKHCADWFDGYPDHSDGGGPYEVRTLYTAPQPAEPVKVPSVLSAIIQAAQFAPGESFEDVEARVRDLLARYGDAHPNVSKSAEKIDTSAQCVDGVDMVRPTVSASDCGCPPGQCFDNIGYQCRDNRNRPTVLATHPAVAEPLVRYCPGCGSIGPVEAKYRDCCPDGDEARVIPKALAEKCRDTFKVAVKAMLAEQACNDAAPVASQPSVPEVDWPAAQAAIKEYVAEYEMIGEADAVYDPTDKERYILNDAICGLLADDDFMALWRGAPAVTEEGRND